MNNLKESLKKQELLLKEIRSNLLNEQISYLNEKLPKDKHPKLYFVIDRLNYVFLDYNLDIVEESDRISVIFEIGLLLPIRSKIIFCSIRKDDLFSDQFFFNDPLVFNPCIDNNLSAQETVAINNKIEFVISSQYMSFNGVFYYNPQNPFHVFQLIVRESVLIDSIFINSPMFEYLKYHVPVPSILEGIANLRKKVVVYLSLGDN